MSAPALKLAPGLKRPMTAPVGGSSMPRPPEPNFATQLLSRLDSRDLAALSAVELLELPDPSQSAAIETAPLPAPLALKRKGTDYWLAQNFGAAADCFQQMALLHADGTAARAQGLRMRASALLRARRFEDAIVGAQGSLNCLGQPAAEASTDKSFMEGVALNGSDADALASWQLLGVAHEALGHYQEATLSLGRALLLASVRAAEEAAVGGATSKPAGGATAAAVAARKKGGELFGSSSAAVAASSLLTHFLKVAGRAQASLLPLQCYVTLTTSSGGRLSAGGSAALSGSSSSGKLGMATRPPPTSAAPAFRLVLRPRFLPWPLDLQVGELPGVEIEGGTRISFYCAYRDMPAEPHACLIAHHHLRSALVLLSIRIDGQLEVLSNSSEAAWDQVQALYGQPPQNRSLHDFDVVASGWTTSGMGVATFTALVKQKWSEWEEGRGKAAAKRKEEERALLKRQAALLEWLRSLGLEELHERLVREGVDLERLQYISEADLSAMGVSQLAQRRQLMAAVQTQQQYKNLMDKISSLERDNADVRQMYSTQKRNLAATTKELAEARESVAKLSQDLQEQRGEAEQLAENGLELVEELDRAKEEKRLAEERADGFAADCAELLGQLRLHIGAQRSNFREIKGSVDRRIFNIVNNAKKSAPKTTAEDNAHPSHNVGMSTPSGAGSAATQPAVA